MSTKSNIQPNQLYKRKPFSKRFVSDFKMNWSLYLLIAPVILFYIYFSYIPMRGLVLAFQEYSPRTMYDSAWVGLKWFTQFFGSTTALQIIGNTFKISILTLIFSFPMPIILAISLNELRSNGYKRAVQTISYMPHFISLVVICGMIKIFTNSGGMINQFFTVFGYDGKTMLNNPDLFYPIYVLSEIWQTIGWGSIVYLAALTNIDVEQYEAARIDGASKMRQILSITIPGIMPTIIVMFIMRLGGLLSTSGFEKIILLYNPITQGVADTIATFVFRKGLEEFLVSYSTAIGLFNSVANTILLLCANVICKKLNETSLW